MGAIRLISSFILIVILSYITIPMNATADILTGTFNNITDASDLINDTVKDEIKTVNNTGLWIWNLTYLLVVLIIVIINIRPESNT